MLNGYDMLHRCLHCGVVTSALWLVEFDFSVLLLGSTVGRSLYGIASTTYLLLMLSPVGVTVVYSKLPWFSMLVYALESRATVCHSLDGW